MVYIVLHIIALYTLEIKLPRITTTDLEAFKLSHYFVRSEGRGNDHPGWRAKRDCSRSNASRKTRLQVAFCTELLKTP